MKKYILVDNGSNTTDHHHIQEGKHSNNDSNGTDESVATIMNAGADSPILAIMEYPGAIDSGTKMFQLQVLYCKVDSLQVNFCQFQSN